MRYYSKMSFKEISEVSGINTALGRMRYAIINLRKIVKKSCSSEPIKIIYISTLILFKQTSYFMFFSIS